MCCYPCGGFKALVRGQSHMDRSLVLRTCIKEHNEYAFEEPFERIGAEMRDSEYNRVEYTVSDILIPFGNQHDCDALAGDFPYNIVQHCSTLFNGSGPNPVLLKRIRGYSFAALSRMCMRSTVLATNCHRPDTLWNCM